MNGRRFRQGYMLYRWLIDRAASGGEVAFWWEFYVATRNQLEVQS